MANLLSTTTIGSSQVLSVANMAEHGVITTSNIGSQSVSYAGSAGSVNGNMQGTFVGDISWNGGVNINVSGESSFDLFTNGQWGVWESQTSSWWIRANWGDHLRLVENGKNVYVYGSRLYNDSGQQAVFNNGGTWGISISGNSAYASSAGNADTVDGYHANNAAGGIAVINANGYWYPPSWINVGGAGIYSGTNNAHLLPNGTSPHGAWEMIGSRGGWSGIYFRDSGNTIMANANDSGFYNANAGWQIEWYNGTLYCYKSANGGGTQATVLDSSNYTSWAPSLTGSGASGTWGISISGNASTASTASNSNALGGIGVGGFLRDDGWNNYPGQDANTQEAMRVDFTYSNNAPYTGELIRFGSSGYSTQLNTSYGNSENFAFRTRNGDNGTWNDWRTIIHSGNIGSQSVSYASSAGNADTLDGLNSSVFVRNDVYNSADAGLQVFRNIGTNTGSWQSDNHTFGLENSDAGYLTINFHRAGYTSNNILYTGSKFNFDTVVESSSDFRAPIFYDSENTGYYLDPASRSNLNMLTLSGAGHFFPNYWIELSGYFGLYSPYNSAHFYPNNASYGSWRCSGSRNGWGGIEFDASNGQVVLMINPSSNTTGFHNNSYGWQFYWESGTLYCYKNSYGGGTQATVLDTSNFTNWAQDKNTAITTSNIGDQSVAYANSAGYVPGMIKGDEWYGSTYIGSGSIYSPIFYDANDSYWVIDPSGYSRYNTADVNRLHNYGWYTNSQWGDSAMLCIGGDFDPAYPIQIETERWGASLYTNKGSLWATDFINSSDISYKTNIVDITSGLSVIESLQPVTYTRIDDSSQKLKAGLIAQEVQDSLPHIVSSTIEPGTLDEVLGVDYVQVIPYLISAIKEQQQQIADLTARIAQLEQ